MKIYVLHKKDGGVSIMHTNEDPLKEMSKWSDSQRSLMVGTYREITSDDLPKSRADRDKWYDDGVKVNVKQ